MVAGVIGDDTLNQINRFRLQESTEVPETTIQNEVLQYEEEHEISLSGRLTLLGKLPYVIMKVSASEPRDVLQLERTLLSFIRFATSLFFTALGIVINFKLDSSGKSGNNKKRPPFNSSTYSTVASFVLFGLSLCVLIISGVNYFITIQRYAKHKIETYNFNNIATVICMTCIIITLIAISISLIIEGYLDESI